MDAFKAAEVFEVAIRIETNGEKIYRHALSLTEDPKTKSIFGHLADEEVKHRKTFQAMASQVAHYSPPEKYPGEYDAYVRAYAEQIVFAPEKMQAELARIKTVDDALEFAIQREIESILYYLEIRNFVPETQRKEVDRIIDEERKHYLRLNDLRRTMN
jgi:rubrerythrin